MTGKIILISDDKDFFEFIRSKLELRKSDELFLFSFEQIIKKQTLLSNGVLIVNSENNKDKTLELIDSFKNLPIIVMSFNEDESFMKKCFRAGAIDFMPLLVPDSEFRARMIPALSILSLIDKNNRYHKILEKKGVLAPESDIFLDYTEVLDTKIEEINLTSQKAVFAAVSANESGKFLLKPKELENILSSNLRRNDLIMNFAPNKYFLLMFNITVEQAEKFWTKISSKFSQQVYAGFVQITNQKRQQLINESLNKLHLSINNERYSSTNSIKQINNLDIIQETNSDVTSFKQFKNEFNKKIENIIIPVFYQFEQKLSTYNPNLLIEHDVSNGCGYLSLIAKNEKLSFKITCPGFTKIHIDITSENPSNRETKRISFEPNEFDAGILEDLLEQVLLEYK